MSDKYLQLSENLSKVCRYHHITHVLVNDPTMVYGIFIENMLKAAGKRTVTDGPFSCNMINRKAVYI